MALWSTTILQFIHPPTQPLSLSYQPMHPPTHQGGKREENVALLLSIQQALREAGQLKPIRLRFQEAVPESVRQVRARR